MSDPPSPRLYPLQVCFVVDDVATGVEECVSRFGWGPFHEFSAPVPEAHYHGWRGPKRTDVALGMAGEVQVELIHVHEGHDTVAAYQARYGRGFQHLGIHCGDREQAVARLESLGCVVDDQNEYTGIRFAFVDTPTGPGMFELLQPTGATPPPGTDSNGGKAPAPSVSLDRATIVTPDLDRTLAFYSRAFGWSEICAESRTLRFGSTKSVVRRARGQAGKLLLELVEPDAGGNDPYARQLVRGDHGLVHAGGRAREGFLSTAAAIEGEWLEEGETFALYDWSGGPATLQLRSAEA